MKAQKAQPGSVNPTSVGKDENPCSLAKLFEETAISYPGQTGIKFKEDELTYGQLNRKAENFSKLLINSGLSPGGRVAISINRSIEMIIAVIACYKAGACCVPIDPDYPKPRIEFMLSNSRAEIHLTPAEDEKQSVACINKLNTKDNNESGDENHLSKSDFLAYVIFTSGSTGNPKGVALPQSALCNLIDW